MICLSVTDWSRVAEELGPPRGCPTSDPRAFLRCLIEDCRICNHTHLSLHSGNALFEVIYAVCVKLGFC